MRRLAVVWPGIALSLTFIDDFVAGPLLALAGGILGPLLGVTVAAMVFTLLVAGLAFSVHAAASHIDPATRRKIDTVVEQASQRRFIGRFVRQVGDDGPIATALVAMLISPVLAVLLARLTQPTQRGHRTLTIAVVAYGLAFSIAYAGGGAAIAAIG